MRPFRVTGWSWSEGALLRFGRVSSTDPRLQPAHDGVGGGEVGGQWDLMDIADPQESGHIGLVRLGSEGIAEEDHGLDGSLNDSGADLEISAMRTGGEAFDSEIGFFIEDRPGGSCGQEWEASEQSLVVLGKQGLVEFSLVVSDQSDGFAFHDDVGLGLSNGPLHATGHSSSCRISFPLSST